MPAFHDLPDEIVSNIFKKLNFATRRTIVPLVCKAWREVTLPSSDLWSEVHLDSCDETDAFNILQKAGLTGGTALGADDRLLIYRDVVMRWFQRHVSVISEVKSFRLGTDPEEAGVWFEIGEEGLAVGLVAVRGTLKRLSLEDANWIQAREAFFDLEWLTNLVSLSLENMAICDPSDLEALACLSKLESLRLSKQYNDELIGLPASFFKLTQLRNLDLATIDLEGFAEGVSALVGLTSLRIFRGGASAVAAIDETVKLTALVFLELRNTRLRILPDMSRLQNLRALNVSSNALTELPPMDHLSGLITLDVGENPLILLPSLNGLQCLKELRCDQNLFSDLPVGSLTGLDSIVELNFFSCRQMVIPESVVQLARLPGLRLLVFERCKLTTLGFVAIEGLLDAYKRERPDVQAVLCGARRTPVGSGVKECCQDMFGGPLSERRCNIVQLGTRDLSLGITQQLSDEI